MMRTLYVRIITTTMIIMIVSAFVSFIVSNIYYHYYLKPENDHKITQVANSIVSVYESGSEEDLNQYLQSMTDLGYSFYLYDNNYKGQTLGEAFKKINIERQDIEKVLAGHTYHGIASFPWRPFITGFFDNELRNTIGVPVHEEGEVKALFVRANTKQQFGEMRIFLALLLIFTLIFSFLFVLYSTSLIVQPIRNLTQATRKIAAGNYHIKLKENRKDEIGRLASDFSKMSNSLAKTEEKRQEFVSNVSHEIQSPLTSIQGFSLALKEEDLTEEERIYYLEIIEKEAKRLSVLSKQLLTLSFLDSEENTAEKIDYNVSDQLKDVVSTLEYQWRSKEIAMTIDTAELMVLGDPKLLYQVWMNLLTNAITYTQEGGSIHIQGIDKHEVIEVIISDTGVGISQEDLNQIFDRFYKVDKARTRTKTSTGLGLAIVKKIVELHEGSIVVDSELDKGSTFSVTFPKK